MRRYELTVEGRSFSVVVHGVSAETADVEVNGTRYTVQVDEVLTEGQERPRSVLEASGTAKPLTAPPPTSGPGPTAKGEVTAPIPGLVMEVFVSEGDTVKKGQPLLKMEAMKMENVVNAPREGTVADIRARSGDTVTQGQLLMVIG